MPTNTAFPHTLTQFRVLGSLEHKTPCCLPVSPPEFRSLTHTHLLPPEAASKLQVPTAAQPPVPGVRMACVSGFLMPELRR